MNNILNNKKSIDKGIFWLCIFFIVINMLLAFLQNFLYSKNFGLIEFRAIDDLAFQQSLRNVHQGLSSGNFAGIAKIFSNDYGYGTVFWLPMALLTYPLYLLHTFYGVDWPLITFPRNISLFFGVLSLVFLYKTIRKYEVSEVVAIFASTLFCLFYTFSYYCGRFGTINQTMFFAILTVYYAVKKNDLIKKDLYSVVFALALAGGTKLSGLLITPFIGLACLTRMKKETLLNYKENIIKPFLLFVFLLILFLSPALFFSPICHPCFANFKSAMAYAYNNTHTNSGGYSWEDGLVYGILQGTMPEVVFFLLFLGLLLNCFSRNKQIIKDSISAILTLIIVSTYLIFNIKMGAPYITNYFTCVSFLLLWGILYVAQFRLSYPFVLYIFVLMSYKSYEISKNSGLGSSTYFYDYKKRIKALKNAEKIEADLASSIQSMSSFNLLVDEQVLTTYNNLRNKPMCLAMVWNNFSKKAYTVYNCKGPADYIILDRNILTNENKNDFSLADAKIKKIHQMDIRNRKIFYKVKKFDNFQYNFLKSYDNIDVFARQSTISNNL